MRDGHRRLVQTRRHGGCRQRPSPPKARPDRRTSFAPGGDSLRSGIDVSVPASTEASHPGSSCNRASSAAMASTIGRVARRNERHELSVACSTVHRAAVASSTEPSVVMMRSHDRFPRRRPRARSVISGSEGERSQMQISQSDPPAATATILELNGVQRGDVMLCGAEEKAQLSMPVVDRRVRQRRSRVQPAPQLGVRNSQRDDDSKVPGEILMKRRSEERSFKCHSPTGDAPYTNRRKH